jgi:sarcosine oxidase, subunit beta
MVRTRTQSAPVPGAGGGNYRGWRRRGERGRSGGGARDQSRHLHRPRGGGTWCPTDGFIRPLEILRGYTGGARRLGARFEYGTSVEAVEREGDRVTAVRTRAGRIAAGAVVNAAGAWAGVVGRMAGVEVPVAPLRRQIAPTVPTDVLPECMPLTVFVDGGFYARVRDGRVLLLWHGEPTSRGSPG